MTRRALISVSDKKGILEFAKGLASLKVEILSTGGTAKLLRENGIPVTEVGDYTGQPEILDGRLKTLHPKIHGGILAVRSNPKHQKELKESRIEPIDLVVVNLYPFERSTSKVPSPLGGEGGRRPGEEGISLQDAIEQIDIGGPTMIRAAAKNWQDVTVIVDPADYGPVLEELRKGGAPSISPETNFRLAKKVFVLTARYDGAIANYLTGGREGKFPEAFHYQGIKAQDLRYGENPHQKAAFYRDPSPHPSPEGGEGVPCVPNARQLHGKELSFNNILDLDAALGLVTEFEEPACVIVKHTNPCGVAVLTRSATGGPPSPEEGEGQRMKELFMAARNCDPLSAFGGIIGFNRKVDPETAKEIAKDFYECVIAPGFDPEAVKILAGKKNIRLMEVAAGAGEGFYDMKKVAGGLLVQERDQGMEDIRKGKVVTKRSPSEEEWSALSFAWKVCKHVKSNAIVLAAPSPGLRPPSPARGEGKLLCTFGMGCGQMSRVDAVRLAISKMPSPLPIPHPGKGGGGVRVLASDAFFPFRDNVDEGAKACVTAIIQPGGSLKDQESIDAADQHGIAMVFTGVRHFRH